MNRSFFGKGVFAFLFPPGNNDEIRGTIRKIRNYKCMVRESIDYDQSFKTKDTLSNINIIILKQRTKNEK